MDPPTPPQVKLTVAVGAWPERGNSAFKVAVREKAYALAWRLERQWQAFTELRQGLQEAGVLVDCKFPAAARWTENNSAALSRQAPELHTWLRLALRSTPSGSSGAAQMLQFLGADERIAKAQAQRMAAHKLELLECQWANVSEPAVACAVPSSLGGQPSDTSATTTRLHRLASCGEHQKLRAVLRSQSGQDDWLLIPPAGPAPHTVRPGYRTPVDAAGARQVASSRGNHSYLPKHKDDRGVELGLADILAADITFHPALEPEPEGVLALNEVDGRGWTAYHHACAAGHNECVLALLCAGCGTTHLTPLGGSLGGKSGWDLAIGPPAHLSVLTLLESVAAGKHGDKSRIKSLPLLQLEQSVKSARGAAGIGEFKQTSTSHDCPNTALTKSSAKRQIQKSII